MRSKLVKFLMFLLAICSLCFVVGCTEEETPITPPETSIKIELSKYTLELERLEDFVLTATVDGKTSNEVTWESSNEAIATVSNGFISAIGAGNAVIIASVDGYEARCVVYVSDHALCPGISTNISQEKLVLVAGDNFLLESQVTYNNKVLDGVETTYSNACEDGSVTVQNGKIIANRKGSAVITLNAEWKGFTCKYMFEVNVVASACVRLHEQNAIELCSEEIGGQTNVTLNPYFVIEDLELSSSQYEITSWDYDEEIVSFDEETLVVQALTKGQTNIVAVFTETETGLAVECVLPITVNLVDYDKTEECVLEMLYLDQADYLILRDTVFFDKTEIQLSGCVINAITDVTYKTTYNIPITSDIETGNARVNTSKLSELGLEGNRKWKVECGKYSYIITVPVTKTNIASPLLGDYIASDWDYNVKLVFENNKNAIKIIEKTTGDTVGMGFFEIKPWKESLNDGTHGAILITLNSKAIDIKDEFQGFYYFVDGCPQIHLTIAGYYNASNYKVLYGANKDSTPTNYLGTYTANSVDLSIELKENGECVIGDVFGEQLGTYSLTPDNDNANVGIIVINGNNGNELYFGTYQFNADNCIMALDGVQETLGRVAEQSEYTKVAGYYGTVDGSGAWNGWCPLYLGADGKVVFAFTLYDRVEPGVGYYTIENGEITINITTGYYKGEYTGECIFSDGGVVTFSVPIYKGQTYRKIV